MLAMRAQAWRWLGQCQQHMLSSAERWQSIALALLRLSAEFILTAPHADICLRFFAEMARAPVHGVPLDDGVVDQQEEQQEQTRATSWSGATAAAGTAKTLQALARPVTEKKTGD